MNPSGRTADTWAADFAADPTYVNFGGFVYDDLEVSYPVSAVESATSNANVTPDATFVNYAEGIYVGYRYYETAAAEGFAPSAKYSAQTMNEHQTARFQWFSQRVNGTDTATVMPTAIHSGIVSLIWRAGASGEMVSDDIV